MWRNEPHCPILQVGEREKAAPEGLGAASTDHKSRQCNGCNMKEKFNVNFKCCSSCKLVFYCSQTCQKRHWKEHQKLCNVIQEQSNRSYEKHPGLGDSADAEVFVSHLSPRKQAAIVKLVNPKCYIRCLINDVVMGYKSTGLDHSQARTD